MKAFTFLFHPFIHSNSIIRNLRTDHLFEIERNIAYKIICPREHSHTRATVSISAIHCTFVIWVNGGSAPPSVVRWSLRMISATHPCIIDEWRKPFFKQTRLSFRTLTSLVSTHAKPNIPTESHLWIYYLQEGCTRSFDNKLNVKRQ